MLFCVPGDGSNNSGGVMGTKNWIWGEISGGVGGGGWGFVFFRAADGIGGKGWWRELSRVCGRSFRG